MNERRKENGGIRFHGGRKADSRDTESWRASKSATKPVNEAGFPHGERDSLISCWLSKFLFSMTVLSLVFHQAC